MAEFVIVVLNKFGKNVQIHEEIPGHRSGPGSVDDTRWPLA